ncbi:hypothetical protein JNUCC64_01525 [Streptomyces sp. JNUCC 64]
MSSSVPEPVPAPQPWERELARAFEVLLDAPFGPGAAAGPAPEPRYAFFHQDDLMPSTVLGDLLDGELDPDAVARGIPVDGARYDEDGVPLGWSGWSFDLGRSIWLWEDDAFDPDGPFGAAAAGALDAVAHPARDSRRAVSGADLARVFAEHGDSLDEVDEDELLMAGLLLRVDTDGTLFDAMRAATWTTGGPEGLVPLPPEAEVEPRWDAALSRVPGARLRDHLRLLCLTDHWARGDGARYLGPGNCPAALDWFADQPGHQVVAGWELGEGQAASAVFRIG